MSALPCWAMVELMGHRVRYAWVSEVKLFGATMCQLDIPTEPQSVELYSGAAIFGITPTSELICRERCMPYLARALPAHVEDDEYDGPDDDDDVHDIVMCAGCSMSITDGTATQVMVDDDTETWHASCANQHAAVMSGTVDSAPTGGEA